MSRLLVMAGGTGGHVYPALAVAERLRDNGVDVVWIGTQTGLEARAVPAAGFEIEWVEVKGLRGKGLVRWLMLPYVLGNAMVQTWAIISRRQPDALLGMGGFVAGPGGLVGWLRRRPLVIHEQNAICGMTNWFLTPLSARVLTGFAKSGLPGRKAQWVGNPVREDIIKVTQEASQIKPQETPKKALPQPGVDRSINVLVVGGSQGARVLNQQVAPSLAGVKRDTQDRAHALYSVWHQCGRNNSQAVEATYTKFDITVRVDDFIDDMASAYRWADLVVCRAGAMTVAEIATCGRAAIFIPYPHAVGDHQAANANSLVEAGAALVVREGDDFSARLTQSLQQLVDDPESISKMAKAGLALAKPDASDVVAQHCLEVMHA